MDTRIREGCQVEVEMQPRVFEPDQVVLEEGEIGAVLEITLKRADGTVKDHWAKKSESYTRQFIDLLIVQMGQVTELNPYYIRDITNTLVPVANSYKNFDSNALVNDDSYSIVIGTGNTAPTITDYVMETKISNGAGAGQLQHSLTAFGLPTSNATQSHFTITRDFSNASGGDITVNEIGLYQKGDGPFIGYSADSRPNNTFLTIRDVIVGGITIGNGETLTINYRLVSQL